MAKDEDSDAGHASGLLRSVVTGGAGTVLLVYDMIHVEVEARHGFAGVMTICEGLSASARTTRQRCAAIVDEHGTHAADDGVVRRGTAFSRPMRS